MKSPSKINLLPLLLVGLLAWFLPGAGHWVLREKKQFNADSILLVNLSGRGDKDIFSIASREGVSI